MPERFIGAVLKTVVRDERTVGSNPTSSFFYFIQVGLMKSLKLKLYLAFLICFFLSVILFPIVFLNDELSNVNSIPLPLSIISALLLILASRFIFLANSYFNSTLEQEAKFNLNYISFKAQAAFSIVLILALISESILLLSFKMALFTFCFTIASILYIGYLKNSVR